MEVETFLADRGGHKNERAEWTVEAGAQALARLHALFTGRLIPGITEAGGEHGSQPDRFGQLRALAIIEKPRLHPRDSGLHAVGQRPGALAGDDEALRRRRSLSRPGLLVPMQMPGLVQHRLQVAVDGIAETGSRRSLFEQLDRPALKALPAVPYEYAEWRHAKVGIDYHIEVDKRCYSVPHRLVGARVDVRLGASTVEVLHQGKRVASHPRQGPCRFSTLDAHMPKAHQAHRQWSPQRFLDWAQAIGTATRAVVAHQLTDRPHPEHGYRACLGLLSHARRYGEARLEGACARALAIASPSYRSVTSILSQGLDQQPLAADEEPATLPSHANVRGARYYH